MSEKSSKVIKNASKACGYNYASLADIVNAGVELPKMRVATKDGRDYIEYLDEQGEWQLGAQIVVPSENKRMNAAQAYGAALTYARRYTVQMAKSLACDDDKKLEAQELPAKEVKIAPRIDIDAFKKMLDNCQTADAIRKQYAIYIGKSNFSKNQLDMLQGICKEYIAKKETGKKDKSFWQKKVDEALSKNEGDIIPTESEVDAIYSDDGIVQASEEPGI